MIEIKELSKSFAGRDVLKNINLKYHRGKVNLIIGASGSGKSVLTKCTVGLVEPDKGKVYYDDKNFTDLNVEGRKTIRTEIGMLFQGSALFDSLTIEENVKFPLRMHSKMSAKEMEERVNFCLKRVDLINVNDRYPAEISGGMQKRVGIARAIALKPKYLFCDEPNSGLDPGTSIIIDNLIKEITYEDQITTIVITHDMNSVMEIGDHISFIYKGEVHWQGDKRSILSTTNKELSDLVFASDLMKKIRSS